MIKVIFKNLERSDLIRSVAEERIEKTISKFPEFKELSSTVIVGREHSQEHSGVDAFSAKLLIEGYGARPVVLEKKAESLYQAIALVTDRALEILHRALDKERGQKRQERRRFRYNKRWAHSF